MASKWINVKGFCKWAKVYDPDDYQGAKRWALTFYPDNEDEWAVIKKSGLQLRPKEDDLGKFIQLRRPVSKVFGDEVTFFSPPKITGAVNVHYVNDEGEEVRQFRKGDKIERVGEPVLIGNESKVIVNICVYDTRQGKGHRLEALNVLDLVEYSASNNKSDAERAAGVRDEPEEEERPKAEMKKETSKKSMGSIMNDELPF